MNTIRWLILVVAVFQLVVLWAKEDYFIEVSIDSANAASKRPDNLYK